MINKIMLKIFKFLKIPVNVYKVILPKQEKYKNKYILCLKKKGNRNILIYGSKIFHFTQCVEDNERNG